MNSTRPITSIRGAHRGSALIAVIIFSAVLLVLVTSIIRWSLSERKLTIRHALLLESRNAAEALAEYGFSQIREKYETRGHANLSPSGPDALKLPPDTFWANSNVSTTSSDIELIGGTVTPKTTPGSSYYYVDPDNPNNANDPLKGKWVWRRDLKVLAKATVKHPTGKPIVSYATQSISIRGAPLFAHAIFYNMDLELAPGPDMNIYGPVHANGNLYLGHQSDNGALTFYGQVTASGHLYHAWKNGIQGSHNSEGALKNGHVKFLNREGQTISMRGDKVGSGYKWNDSLMGGTSVSTDFRAFASNTWNGNLLTASHGITNYNPVAIGEYREANPQNPSVSVNDPSKAPSNAGRLIIEPSNYPADPSAPDYARKMEVEAQKYSNDAGIYITVIPPTTVDGAPTIVATSRSKQDPTKNKTITLPTNNFIDFEPFKLTTTEVTYTESKQGKTTYYTPVTKVTVTTPAGSQTTETVGSATTTKPKTSKTTVHNSGLYDRRRLKGVNLVKLDMDGLRKAVAQMSGSSVKLSNGTTYTPSSNASGNANAISGLSSGDWTGIVYVEVAGAPSTDPLTGATIKGSGALASAADGTAVFIHNGTGKVPTYGTSSPGLTVATNAPMYVKGHYNADGVTHSDTNNNSAHVPESGEVPAALVADAITLLSPGFDVTKTYLENPTQTNLANNRPTASGPIEISAALLMGLTPTGANNLKENSGGAHNFPRFLENYDKKDVFIRGSLVALFESRIATEPWSTDYFRPPNRNWGFNDLFATGIYPPGTPRVMSYRRVDFTHLDEKTYNEIKSGFSW